MPGYPWLAENPLQTDDIEQKMLVLKKLGAPYTGEQIQDAPKMLEGKTEMDAVVAYLQYLGTAIKTRR